MTARERTRDALRALLNKGGGAQGVMPATVVSLEGSTCTVRLLDSAVEYDGVRMKATPDSATEGIRAVPKAGSLVLVGPVADDDTDLMVLLCDALESLTVTIGDRSLSIDGDSVTLTQGNATVEVKGGKVKVEAGGVNLKTLFSDLTTACSAVVIGTPNGPGTATFNFTTLNSHLNTLLQ